MIKKEWVALFMRIDAVERQIRDDPSYVPDPETIVQYAKDLEKKQEISSQEAA